MSFKDKLKKPSAVEAEISKMKPTLYLSSEEYPEIKDWELGKDYTVIMHAASRTAREEAGADGKVTMDLELKSLGESVNPDETEPADEPLDE